MKLKVLVVDDEALARSRLRTLVGDCTAPAAVVAAEAASAAEAVSALRLGTFDAVLLDIRMPGVTGTALHDELLRRGARVPVIFITGHGDIPMAVDAMRKGAFDFIEKPFDDEQLLSQVRAALERFDGDQKSASDPVSMSELSERQREVLRRVLDGKPSRQIADELEISVKTVEFHRARIMQKLGVRTAAELFRRCLGAG